MKYIAYCRKSTDEPDKQILSIEGQLDELKEFAKREKLNIVGYITESKTAKKPGRAKFAEVLKLIEQEKANGILSWHPDRLARNSIDGGQIIYLLDTGKLKDLKFPTFWFDNTPQGTISNEYDPTKGSRVIKLDNSQAIGWSTGYILGDYSVTLDRNPNDEAWNNTEEFRIGFSIKCPVSETSWRIYVSTSTDFGHRYITYAGTTHGGTDYVPIILTGINDNKWHSIPRNLNNDLHTEEPENNILSVDGFLIRGNCSVDDIKLRE